MRIYWERNSQIWWAERATTGQKFGGAQFLLEGRNPTPSDGELEIIVTINDVLHSAARKNRQEPFSKPQPIAAFQGLRAKVPSLSTRGMLTWFDPPLTGPKRFWMAQRPSGQSDWFKPQEIKIVGLADVNAISSPQLLDNGKTLLVNDESDAGGHRFILLLRNTQTGEFAISTELTGPPGQKLFGRSPRYVPMTDELYFVSTRTRQISRSPDGRIADDWDLFRLTHASIAFGSDASQHLLP